MDIEERARRQSRRVIISELLMVFTVIITVLILAFIVSGYWVSPDFKIERQGLLQIYSSPTGADITIDDNAGSWLSRTNTSMTLSAGEHKITLTKEGYDSWSRTVKITEGLLYKLHYPRLFPKKRTVESALDFSANFATITPDRNFMLLADNTTNWQLVNLDTDKTKPTTLDLSEILPFTNQADKTSVGLFSGVIENINWASDNEHLLLKIKYNTAINWLLLNIKNPSASVNLTKEFNADFDNIEILNQSASNLLAVIKGNLHRIDIPTKQISAVLVEDIISFDFYEQNLVFIAKNKDVKGSDDPYYIGLLKFGTNNIVPLKTIQTPDKIAITKFYDDEYICVINENSATLYLKNNFIEKNTFTLTFAPEKIKVGTHGESIIMYTKNHIATLDMEAMQVFDWFTDGEDFGWLDGNMIYSVKAGILNVYDFNGLNHRELSKNVSAHFPISITADKYLYYVSDGSLIREHLIEK